VTLRYQWTVRLSTTKFADPITAPLICIKPNIKAVEICDSCLCGNKAVNAVLRFPWSGNGRPFQKLKFITTSGCGSESVPFLGLLPAVELLSVAHTSRGDYLEVDVFEFPRPSSGPVTPTLTDL
jgi:hypothetical protein